MLSEETLFFRFTKFSLQFEDILIDYSKNLITQESMSALFELARKSGVEALKQCAVNPPELMMLDIWMPEMDGLETLRRLRELVPHTQVMMMSGHGSIETAVKAIKLGAYDYIEKPLSLENRMRLSQVGFFIVIAIMVWALSNDVLRLFGI